MRSCRSTAHAIAAALLAAPLCIQPAQAQRRDPGVTGPVSGTFSIRAQGAAAGTGYTWREGTLRYGSRSYRFSISGVTVADAGASKVTGTGRVYNLQRLQDFSGTYAATAGEATLGNGIGGQVLRNVNGVQVRVDHVTSGARLQGSADGIKLSLK